MTTTNSGSGPSDPGDDRFLDRVGREGRLAPSPLGPDDARRLRTGFSRRLDSARRSRRRAGWLGAVALLLVAGSAALSPRGAVPDAMSSADAEDDQLLRQVRACREAPDLAGLRSAMTVGLSDSATRSGEAPGPVAPAVVAPDSGVRS